MRASPDPEPMSFHMPPPDSLSYILLFIIFSLDKSITEAIDKFIILILAVTKS